MINRIDYTCKQSVCGKHEDKNYRLRWVRHTRSVVAQHSLTEAVDKGMKKVDTGFNFVKDYIYTIHPTMIYRRSPGSWFSCEEKTGRLGWDYDIVKIERMEEKGVSRDLTPVSLRKAGSGDE